MGFFNRLFGRPAREGGARPTVGDPASAGLSILLQCFRDDNLSPAEDLSKAAPLLRGAGEDGSNAVAGLIRDLLESRSPAIGWALAAAKSCVKTSQLHDVVCAVAAAPELRAGSAREARFTPEIFGDGKIGWTTGSTTRIHRLARETLDVWDPPVTTNEPRHSKHDGDPDVQELVAAVKRFRGGQEHASTVTAIGKRVGAKAVPALRGLIESDGSGPMALSVVYAVRDWQDEGALPFIRHALGTGYPGAEYYGAEYLNANPTPQSKQVARECLPRVKDDDSRRWLRELLDKS